MNNREILLVVIVAFFILESNTYGQKNKLISIKVEYEYFSTESFERINCNSFYESFKKSIKTVYFKEKDKVKDLSLLVKHFEKNKEVLDVRGVITFNYKNQNIKYCFDRYGYFERNGITFYNKKLLDFLEVNIKF
jgi:uncharacterized protein YxeA